MNRFEAIQTFVRVAELGSFTRAADDLNLSRARVSQQVVALEKHLGARLLNRTTRRVSLTGEGSEYLERVSRVLTDLSAADDAVMQTRSRPTGLLRVDVPVVFGRYLLIPALPRFAQRYPDLTLEVQLNDRFVDFVAERIDVALRAGKVTQSGLIARVIARMRVVTCASPAYLAAAPPLRTIEDLRQHRCIGLLSSRTGRLRDWGFLQGNSRLRYRPNCPFSFNTTESVIDAAIAGAGVVQTVDMVASHAISTDKLRIVLPETSAPGPTLSVIYPAASRHSVKVRVFADFAERLLQDWQARRKTRS